MNKRYCCLRLNYFHSSTRLYHYRQIQIFSQYVPFYEALAESKCCQTVEKVFAHTVRAFIDLTLIGICDILFNINILFGDFSDEKARTTCAGRQHAIC